MENNTNNIQIEEMDCWAVDDWAAFGISLWTLQRKIKEDPAYISESVDILVGLREVVPRLSRLCLCRARSNQNRNSRHRQIFSDFHKLPPVRFPVPTPWRASPAAL